MSEWGAFAGVAALLGGLWAIFSATANAADTEPKREPDDPEQPERGGAGVPRAPQGMGLAIRSLNHTRFLPNPDNPSEYAGRFDGPALLAFLQEHGFTWVAIQAAHANPDGTYVDYAADEPKAKEVADLLHENGITVGIWGWPDPRSENKWLREYDRAVQNVRANFVKVNPERPYHSKGYSSLDHKTRAASATRIMDFLEGYGVPIIVSSYAGGPKSHGAFTWDEWSRPGVIGQPQLYDTNHKWSSAKAQSFVKQWQSKFDRIDPILGGSNAHKQADMLREADEQLGPLRPEAFAWWDLYWLAKSKKRAEAARMVGEKYG